jgi:hypothetical protein
MRGLATRKTQSVYAARSLEGGSRGVRSAGAKNLAQHAIRPRFVLDGGLTPPGADGLPQAAYLELYLRIQRASESAANACSVQSTWEPMIQA